ncbi:LptF/LptG family permease [Pseudooceanicola sp.]|uniref:LptF/LptG family permease n=1 Tax=Pseudooceanicola sp. TaxID=1914328 RepID=UPI0026199B41|nr:LptF/LptG family permease [Pseudooceanicola sp.]MDF1856026.1 LptF/LptG family permease [Pseudooceanicola sp.]
MRPYLRLVLGPTLTVTLSILALVEIVFLAEEFTGLLETIVSTGGSAFDLIRLLSWKIPEILDLALPIAILVGVHTAVGRSRRDGELVVLSAAGAPSWGLVSGFLLVGLLGACLSFAISGFIAPASSFAQRLALHEMTVSHIAEQISAPGESGTTLVTNGTDFVATGTPDGPPSLMVRRPPGSKPWRYAFAGDWEVLGPDVEGNGTFRLGQVSAFGDLERLDGKTAEAQLNRMAAGSVKVGFSMEDVLPVLDNVPRRQERPVLPLTLGIFSFAAVNTAIDPQRLALTIGRSMLVPAAVLLALMAVCGGTVPGVRAAAFPMALIGLVLTDLVARAWLGGFSTPRALTLATLFVAVAAVAVPISALRLAGEALIRPGRG